MPKKNKLSDDRPFGQDKANKALQILRKYKEGKTSIDHKATENQEWWKLRHWAVIQGHTNEAKIDGKPNKDQSSAWAVNSILNKHADIMDSFPKPNILPRTAEDEAEARMLSSIIPVILDRNNYENVYRDMGWDISVDGAAITCVLWDNAKYDGMGDIAINNIDVHNLFWQPGVKDIQDSKYVFNVTIEDLRDAKAKYPDVADKIGPTDSGIVDKYIHDDNIDTSNCIEVVDCYYKRTVYEPVYMDGLDTNGKPTKIQIHSKPVTVLHMVKIVGDQIVFASENEPGYERGFYEHGKYPFVVRRLFPVKDSIWGFGYLDIMKNPQRTIDQIDAAITRNVDMKSRPRYWIKKNAAISREEFADWSNELVEVGSGDLGKDVMRIETDTVPNAAFQHLANKVDELKETSGNRDFSQGSTQSGVTAASAIAALQEAGSKLSRDINKELYRGAREEYELIVELIRQFYDEERSFRIDDNMGGYTFQTYSNQNIKERDVMTGDGVQHKNKAVFDIKITAEKQSPFSRAAQNETAKEMYGMGLFHPENAIPALTCIDMMDFEGKDKIKKQIQDNATMIQQYQMAMQMIADLSMTDPYIAQMAMQTGLFTPETLAQNEMARAGVGEAPRQMPSRTNGATAEERAANISTGDRGATLAAKARQRVANATTPR